jgi:hypothetical protein
VDLGIVIPLVVLPIAVVGAFVWYRRSIAGLASDDDRSISGVRLTAEALHRLDSPPWRVVHETGAALGGVDHVLIGPPGVIAITTVVSDRPTPEQLVEASSESRLLSEAAIECGPVDELVRPASAECRVAAHVFWGTPDPQRPAYDDVVRGRQIVEGQRIDEWAASLPSLEGFGQARIDLAWRAVTMGIGRPDPLS